MKKVNYSIFILLIISFFFSCATTRSKKEVKGFKKFYHNTTAKFNGYFNAEELMKSGMASLEEMNVDNYNGLLSVYNYVDVDNPQLVRADMDKAIEKLSTVATIHDVSNYVDDCYLLIGKAQYLKQDYIAAEETFLYFEEVFDPKNPYGKAYDSRSSKSKNGRATKKEIKEQREEILEERKIKADQKEEERKTKEQERKDRDKERKDKAKERKKQAEEARKNRKKGSRNKSKDDKKEVVAQPSPSTEAKAPELTPQQKALLEEQEEQAKILAAANEEEAKKRLALENEKKKNRAKEEEKYRNQGEGAIFKNKTVYTEGLYWLARTYIETERFASADYTFKKLEETPGLISSISNEIHAAKAHLYLRTKEYDRALSELETAIEVEGDRNKKARYAFIRAQLFELEDDADNAYAEYRRARKFSTKYELDINANINELKLSYRKGQTSQKKALSKLDNYLADHKNAAFADQIHFTKAQIKLDANDLIGAQEDFNLAISSTGGNPNVKLEAYYRLAELLFQQGYYTESKDNYDNALKIMKKTDDRYSSVERLSKSLTDIASNMKTIMLQDSLLLLSKMSDDQLKELAISILEKQKSSGATDLESDKTSQRKSNIITSNGQLSSGRSKFFAYNPITLNQGKVEFNRTWGDIVLEDNWRRSLRPNASLAPEDIVVKDEIDEVVEIQEDEIREFLRDVPRNETQINSSNLRIQNALFQLGVLFRDRIRNFEKSIAMLERLVTQYPDFERRDEALFYLYLSYSDVNNETEASRIKNLLKSEYPDSKFTKLATDPGYADSLRNDATSIEKYYETTFDLFEQGEYQTVAERIIKKDELFGNSRTYAAKFAILNAMSLGNLQGKNEYIDALNLVIRSYPNSPEETRAKEIMRFLKGDQDAFSEILYDEESMVFEAEHDKLHYIFIVTYGLDQQKFDKTKLDVLNYNKKFHRFENLKLSNIYLSQTTAARIILIRSFDNKEQSMKYYEGVKKNKNLFILDENIGYDIFPTTQKNYREVIKQKSITSYRVFFDKNYLN